MNERSYRVLLLPPILILSLGAYRSWYLASKLSEDWQPLFTALYSYDLWFAGWLALILSSLGILKNLAVRILAGIISFCLLLAFSTDIGLTIELNQRLNIYDILRFLPEIDAIRSFITWRYAFLLLLLIPCSAISFRLKKQTLLLSAVVGLSFLVLSQVLSRPVSPILESYSYSVLNWSKIFPKRDKDTLLFQYSSAETAMSKRLYATENKLGLIDPTQNIILIVIESLSAVDSKKISGIRNHLARFDRFSENGMLFTNFFANHEASEGGIQSLISGVPPLTFPMASRFLFREFSKQDSIIPHLKALGFHTEFITTTQIEFVEQNEYLQGVGFDRFVGRDQVKEFAEAPRVVQFAPSDDYLYREALQRVDRLIEQEKPFFMVLANASSHPPYRHPYSDDRTPEGVWDWVIEQIENFYNELDARGYFENGLLIVTADHRRMVPVRDLELNEYGESAKARIPLLIIGSGIPKNKVDNRFFQQADLIPKLRDTLDPQKSLSPNPIWVERYTRAWGQLRKFGHITIFDEAEGGQTGYPARFSGKDIDWVKGKPQMAAALEKRLHMLRAVFQDNKLKRDKTCALDFGAEQLHPSKENGFRVDIYRKAGINGSLETDSARFIERQQIPVIDFPSLESESPFPVTNNFSLNITTFIDIKEDGNYWFRTDADDGVCLAIDKNVIYDRNKPGIERRGEVEIPLQAGMHRLDLRYFQLTGKARLRLMWILPGEDTWSPGQEGWQVIPEEAFFLPVESDLENKVE